MKRIGRLAAELTHDTPFLPDVYLHDATKNRLQEQNYSLDPEVEKLKQGVWITHLKTYRMAEL